MRKKILLVLLLVCLQVTGCVSIPPEQLSRAIKKDELSGHVRFLAQPALKGRKPRTWESATVRQYLKSRFETYGLVPWADRKGYEQQFGFGTNVIGVLPGSDPNLADEIVMVAAHYDHLGKTKKGTCLGACDNASGVAVLLEIAERLALSERRPRRPVCFASFDCEETFTLGSFAFTCQQDFDESRIAAVVNIDMLGRNGFEVLDDTLFLVGTERYPTLRKEILQMGTETGVRILPVGSDLIGPRGDHVVFETMGIPVLFFTCGLYKDYHQPADTADKLNYAKMKRSAAVVLRTVEILANAKTIDKPIAPKGGDVEELQTIKFSMAKISSNYESLGLTEEQGKKIAELAAEADRLANQDKYSNKDRRRFCWKSVETLGPLLEWPMIPKELADSNEGMLARKEMMSFLQSVYFTHRLAFVKGMRLFVAQLVKRKPGLFRGVPKFTYKTYDLAEDELSFVETDDGRYALNVLLIQIQLEISSKMSGWVFSWPELRFGYLLMPLGCVGSREEIVDYSLLVWRENLKDSSYGEAFQKILKTVTTKNCGSSYDEWLKWRLKEGGWPDEKKWVLDAVRSDNPDLARAAVSKAHTIAGDEGDLAIFNLIGDKNVRADVRGRAISVMGKDVERKGLLALVDMLADETPHWQREHMHFMDESYPFSDYPLVLPMRKWYEERAKSWTLGQEAENRLKQLTKKDFGKDGEAWRKWIEANVK